AGSVVVSRPVRQRLPCGVTAGKESLKRPFLRASTPPRNAPVSGLFFTISGLFSSDPRDGRRACPRSLPRRGLLFLFGASRVFGVPDWRGLASERAAGSHMRGPGHRRRFQRLQRDETTG